MWPLTVSLEPQSWLPWISSRSCYAHSIIHKLSGCSRGVKWYSLSPQHLFSFLFSCVKSVFISGPIPTLACGAGRFSRLLSLYTWLQPLRRPHNIGFINNFILFWNLSDFPSLLAYLKDVNNYNLCPIHCQQVYSAICLIQNKFLWDLLVTIPL